MNTPLEIFLCMIGSEIFSKIVEGSNIFLFQMKKERVKPLTLEELRRIDSILMYMSLLKLPQRRRYWSFQCIPSNETSFWGENGTKGLLSILLMFV